MGNLTNDMTRLRGEVDALRGVRGALMQDLTRGARDLTSAVAAMRAGFASAHAAMAKKTGGERETFVAAVIDEVNSLLGEFSRDRNDMARNGRHERGAFLSDLSRQVKGLCKDTADDLIGARLVWRGESLKKSRPVLMKKKPVVIKPVSPPMEAALKKTVATTEFKAEKSPLAFKEPPQEEEKKTVAAPEIKTEKSPVTFSESLKEEVRKTVVAAPKASAPTIKTPKVKMPPPAFAVPEAPKQKVKSWLDEKPAKTATKGKRGKK